MPQRSSPTRRRRRLSRCSWCNTRITAEAKRDIGICAECNTRGTPPPGSALAVADQKLFANTTTLDLANLSTLGSMCGQPGVFTVEPQHPWLQKTKEVREPVSALAAHKRVCSACIADEPEPGTAAWVEWDQGPCAGDDPNCIAFKPSTK